MGQLGAINKLNRSDDTAPAGKTGGVEGSSFSAALQGATQAQGTCRPEDVARAARVQELKAQVANGQYQPDLTRVASSLLKFLAGGA
jgi:negative regulator of flagellin synthesis FlgM